MHAFRDDMCHLANDLTFNYVKNRNSELHICLCHECFVKLAVIMYHSIAPHTVYDLWTDLNIIDDIPKMMKKSRCWSALLHAQIHSMEQCWLTGMTTRKNFQSIFLQNTTSGSFHHIFQILPTLQRPMTGRHPRQLW